MNPVALNFINMEINPKIKCDSDYEMTTAEPGPALVFSQQLVVALSSQHFSYFRPQKEVIELYNVLIQLCNLKAV